jgi:hypothetical protein
MHATARIATATLIGIGLTAGATPVFAQGSQNAQQSAQAQKPSAQATHVSDGQIHKFAKAENQVQNIRSKWQGKIKGAKNKQTAMQYSKQANQSMVKAVRGSGLSVKQYNKIARAAMSQPKLAQRIRQAQ